MQAVVEEVDKVSIRALDSTVSKAHDVSLEVTHEHGFDVPGHDSTSLLAWPAERHSADLCLIP